MKIFLDTEFYEDGRTIELISIGLVNEDGEQYYAETPKARRLAHASEWLEANVLPGLNGGDAVKGRYQIANEIVEFVGDNPEFWAWYGSYDWVALCQLYGAMIDLPKTWPMFIRDFKQVCTFANWTPEPISMLLEHNALEDANWVRREFLAFEQAGLRFRG